MRLLGAPEHLESPPDFRHDRAVMRLHLDGSGLLATSSDEGQRGECNAGEQAHALTIADYPSGRNAMRSAACAMTTSGFRCRYSRYRTPNSCSSEVTSISKWSRTLSVCSAEGPPG